MTPVSALEKLSACCRTTGSGRSVDWSLLAHMLWGLFILMSGKATFLVTVQLVVSTTVAVPGFVLLPVFLIFDIDPDLADAWGSWIGQYREGR